MKRRLLILTFFLLFAFNVPFPNLALKKEPLSPKWAKGWKLKYDPVTFAPQSRIKIEGVFDSVAISTWDSLYFSKDPVFTLPLTFGKNRFPIFIYHHGTRDSFTVEIYRGREMATVAFVGNTISPIPKILSFIAKTALNYQVQTFFLWQGEWFELKREGIKKVKKPDFPHFNSIMLEQPAVGLSFQEKTKPTILLSIPVEKTLMIREGMVNTGDERFSLRDVEIFTKGDEFTDTIFTLEPYQIPLFGKIGETRYLLNLSNLYETFAKEQEVLIPLLLKALERTVMPVLDTVTLNGKTYAILEPPKPSPYFRVEIFDEKGQRVFPSLLLFGFQELKAREDTTLYTIKAYWDKIPLEEIKVKVKPEEKAITERTSARIRPTLILLPAQSNATFLILFFITAGLIYTFGKWESKSHEDGGYHKKEEGRTTPLKGRD